MSAGSIEDFKHPDVFRLLRWTVEAVNLHWKTLYSHGMWMDRLEARKAVESGWKMMET